MSEKRINKCDGPNCGKTTLDYYLEPGWLHLDGDSRVTQSVDRQPTGNARAHYLSTAHGNVLDFCSIGCFVRTLESTPLPEKEKAK